VSSPIVGDDAESTEVNIRIKRTGTWQRTEECTSKMTITRGRENRKLAMSDDVCAKKLRLFPIGP
jgi:hypothetical protein